MQKERQRRFARGALTATFCFVSEKANHTNRLAREKSPYLLQHQHNPVDWYAWGEEAFARARAENKPILVEASTWLRIK